MADAAVGGEASGGIEQRGLGIRPAFALGLGRLSVVRHVDKHTYLLTIKQVCIVGPMPSVDNARERDIEAEVAGVVPRRVGPRTSP